MEEIVNLVLGVYRGEPCRICGKTIEEADLDTVVFAGYSQDNAARVAHQECWNKYPVTEPIPHPQWVHQ